MLADLLTPPTWVCVLIVVATYVLLGTAVALLWIKIGAWGLDRRLAAREDEPRPERARASQRGEAAGGPR